MRVYMWHICAVYLEPYRHDSYYLVVVVKVVLADVVIPIAALAPFTNMV